jgi:hypothetical protein
VRVSSLKIGLAALATGALLVAGNALVGLGSGGFGFTTGGSEATIVAGPPQLIGPPDVEPRPRTHHRHSGERTSSGSATSKASKPRAGSSASTDTQLVSCTKRVSSAASLTQALSSAGAGDKICATGDMSTSRLSIDKGGTASSPLRVVGSGSTVVKGITVTANNVLVSGFSVVGAKAPGIELKGSNITASNNTVKHPTGGDADGLRFFGKNIKILNNTITDINPGGGKAHADCMQTFATGSDSPASQNVVISGNRCERIDNQCLIAEGPNSSAGDGSGQGSSSNITFINNYCDVGASQALQIDDVSHVKVSGNTITGTPDKAFSFQNKSTNAIVTANKVAKGIGYQVGMDSSSKSGYSGPEVGGGP